MLEVLHEDNHLLAVNKPAMLPTMGVSDDRPSLLSTAKEYVRRNYHKPGNVYLGIVSRLDAPVTGVVLLARTSKAAARLTAQFKDRRVEKTYWALADGRVSPAAGRLVHYLRKDERHRRMHVCAASASGALRAELEYCVLQRVNDATTLLEIRLLTGRKHQIRVQLAERGFPVVGDRKYGSRQTFPNGIALHARRLAVEHPVRKEPLVIKAPIPSSWLSILGGPM